MNTYRIGTVLSLAIALIAYPGENLFAAKKRGPAPQAQANTKPNPKDPGGHSAKGVEFAKKKEYDKAVEEFTKAIEAEPQDAKNYFNRATAYRGLNKLTEAFNDYSKAIEMDAKNILPTSAAAKCSSSRSSSTMRWRILTRRSRSPRTTRARGGSAGSFTFRKANGRRRSTITP
jgi:tetratricopeptide (TPR) repeat protein